LLRKPQKMLGGYFILPHPVYVSQKPFLQIFKSILGHVSPSETETTVVTYISL